MKGRFNVSLISFIFLPLQTPNLQMCDQYEAYWKWQDQLMNRWARYGHSKQSLSLIDLISAEYYWIILKFPVVFEQRKINSKSANSKNVIWSLSVCVCVRYLWFFLWLRFLTSLHKHIYLRQISNSASYIQYSEQNNQYSTQFQFQK